jgi:hypothetical protein
MAMQPGQGGAADDDRVGFRAALHSGAISWLIYWLLVLPLYRHTPTPASQKGQPARSPSRDWPQIRTVCSADMRYVGIIGGSGQKRKFVRLQDGDNSHSPLFSGFGLLQVVLVRFSLTLKPVN